MVRLLFSSSALPFGVLKLDAVVRVHVHIQSRPNQLRLRCRIVLVIGPFNRKTASVTSLCKQLCKLFGIRKILLDNANLRPTFTPMIVECSLLLNYRSHSQSPSFIVRLVPPGPMKVTVGLPNSIPSFGSTFIQLGPQISRSV